MRHDPATARTAVGEVHDTIEAAVDRAERLRDQFAAAGWEPCDIDVENPR